MFEKMHDRLFQIAGLYQLLSINEKLSCSCNKEKPEKIQTKQFLTARKYSDDPVKIKKRTP